MNIILFLIILAIAFFVLFYSFMFQSRKKAFAKKVFWISGIISVIYGIVFSGVIDRIFIIIFAIFLVFAKIVTAMIET